MNSGYVSQRNASVLFPSNEEHFYFVWHTKSAKNYVLFFNGRIALSKNVTQLLKIIPDLFVGYGFFFVLFFLFLLNDRTISEHSARENVPLHMIKSLFTKLWLKKIV